MYVKLIYPLKGEYRGKSGIYGPFSRFISETFLLELVMHVCKSEDFEGKTMVCRLDKGEEKHKYEPVFLIWPR